MVKSLPLGEVAVLQQILPDYFEHVRRCGASLLPQFCGCHAIRYGVRTLRVWCCVSSAGQAHKVILCILW